MPNFTEKEIEIRNDYIRLYGGASEHLSILMRLASVGEKIADREYFRAFCKVADIYYSSKKLDVLTEDESSDLKSFKDILKTQAEGE